MLQRAIRPSLDIEDTASPANSMAKPVPASAPIAPITARATSFAETGGWRAPRSVIRIERERRCGSTWVARTCSSSDVPIPKARAPKAPWVEVWLSAHTSTSPGNVKPCSGPTMCTIPWRTSSRPMWKMPASRRLVSSDSSRWQLLAPSWSHDRSVVGIM